MESNIESNDLFKTGNLILVAGYTIFAFMHVIITFLLEWDKWVIILIGVAMAACWGMYIKSYFSDRQRLWIIAIIMMCNYFMYGIHLTSTYDLAVVMAAIMMLFIMTGLKNLITLCQVTYYITMTYDLIVIIKNGGTFGVLDICRLVMHYSVITMLSYFLRMTINKWDQVENSSQKEIEKLTESTERLNDFLANVSHEIRTPVNAIIGLSSICIEKEERPEIRNDMESVRKAGRRVSDQIGDILDFSEIDRGKMVKNPEDYMLSSAMNDIMIDLRDMRKEGVELVIDVDPSIPAVMNTDVTKIKKIVKALVSNGIKYTNEGGVYVKISYNVQDYGVNLCIEVRDTGIGMTAEELNRVYDKFYQSDSGRARYGSGLGLGLAIVSGFVSVLGGFMTINSKKDEGTTVRVSIPQKVVENVPCMSLNDPKNLSVAAFLNFDDYGNPMVREFYDSQARSLSKGLGLSMHRVENADNLKKMNDTLELTHLFIGEKEYINNKSLVTELSKEVDVTIVGEKGDQLDKPAGIRFMEKPFYAFPLVTILNSDRSFNKDVHSKKMKIKDVHVLVVDDEHMNIVVARSIFKRYGMKVSSAASGYESVDMCRKEKYDLIFMDHMMGGMDGVEAMKKIRADVNGLNHDVPMIALTANAMSSAKQMFMSEGFDGFVSKPIEIEELERTLRKLLPKSSIYYVDNEETEEENSVGEENSEIKEKETSQDDDVMEFGPASETTEDVEGQSESNETLSDDELKSKLSEYNIDVNSGLVYTGNDMDLYSELAIQYATEASNKLKDLARYYKSKDWKNYEIIIHAVKSTSKMVGIEDMYDEALTLEMAAKGENEAVIIENHDKVMERFDIVRKAILQAFKLEVTDIDLSKPDGDSEVMEFGVSEEDDEVMEFGATDNEDEVMEFTPSNADDEVMEFDPVTEES